VDRGAERELLQRALRNARDGVTDLAEREERYPVRSYTDPEVLHREKAAIFLRSPLLLAPASQLREPGEFLTASPCGVPTVTMRAPTGQLRAFVNVCRHRGAQLLAEPQGKGLKRIVCPYHAWAYDLDGSLRAVPDEEVCFPNLDRGSMGLVPLPVAERAGFVWLTLKPGDEGAGAAAEVSEFLGPLEGELGGNGFGDFVVYRQESQRRRFNWKLGVEGFLENYHFAVLHKNSTSRIFVHNVATFDRMDSHIRAVAPKRSIMRLGEADEGEWELGPNVTLLYVVFPNTCIFVEKSHFSMLQVWPIDVEHSEVVITHAVRHDSLRLRSFWDENIRIFMSAASEDLDMCESIQACFAGGANEALTFGRNEVACMMFRQRVDEALAAAEPGRLEGSRA
jgi:carnitine monooxygenase subunit